MHDTSEDPADRPAETGPRRRWLWLSLAIVVGAVAGASGTYFVMRGASAAEQRVWTPPRNPSSPEDFYTPTAIREFCLDRGRRQTVVVHFEAGAEPPDAAMRAAAAELGSDARIERLTRETQRQAYEDFKKLFAGKKELLAKARPEALPASLEILPAEGVYPGDIAATVRTRFPGTTVSGSCEPEEGQE